MYLKYICVLFVYYSFNFCLLRLNTIYYIFLFYHLLHFPFLPFTSIYYIFYYIIIAIRNLGHLKMPFITIYSVYYKWCFALLPFISFISFVTGATVDEKKVLPLLSLFPYWLSSRSENCQKCFDAGKFWAVTSHSRQICFAVK